MDHPLLLALTSAGGFARSAELSRALGVHRNTMSRWVRELSNAGQIQRVCSRTIRLAPHSTLVAPGVKDHPRESDRLAQHLNESLERVEGIARQLEALCAARLEVHQTAPNCTIEAQESASADGPEVHQTAPNCTTEEGSLTHVYAGAFPPAVFVNNNCSSNAREEVHIEQVHIADGIESTERAQAPTAPRENPSEAIEERRALNRKRQAFIRAYQELWRAMFPHQRPEPIGILSSMRHFAKHEMASLSEEEWRSSVQQWLEDPAMARQHWPVRFLIAGLSGEFAPKLETVPCEEVPQGTEPDQAPIELSETLRAEGWLYETEWRNWKLQEDCPALAAQLFTMQFPWEGVGSVYPPMRAVDDGVNLTLKVTGTSAGHWAVDNIDVLRWAAKRASRTLTRVVCAATNYVWAEFETAPSAPPKPSSAAIHADVVF